MSSKSPFSKSHPDMTWKRVFEKLDRAGQGLNIQIRRSIVYAVETGLLQPGDKLPSSRQLGDLLGIARNTVTAAYAQLIAEEFLVSRERSGTFVGERDQIIQSNEDVQEDGFHWQKVFVRRPSQLPQFTKPRDWLSYDYPFLYGQFDPTIFPTNNWREALRATSGLQDITGWASDLIDEDDPDLIDQLRVQILPRRGIFAKPGEIIITIGSQQALSMLVQLFVNRESIIGLEDPGYPDMRNMIDLSRGRYQILNADDEGIIPDENFAACQMAFLTINNQCPTTKMTSHQRRLELLEAANRHNTVIVEDDYEADLTPDSDCDTRPLKSLDKDGSVLYVGSFSKSLAPGLRVGFIVAPLPVIRELRDLRRILMRHPPTNNQRVLATFIGLGHYQSHLHALSQEMNRRADLMEAALRDYLPFCPFHTNPHAKSYWLKLPDGMDGRALETAARKQNVLIEAGALFFQDPGKGKNFIRLGIGSIQAHRIETGIKTLGQLIQKHRGRG